MRPVQRSGFTLAELLIVIGIIMLLMGLLFPAMMMVKRQAQRAKCQTLIASIRAACENYRQKNGAYPDCADPALPAEDMDKVFTQTAATATTAAVFYHAQDVGAAGGWETVAEALRIRLETVDREHFSNANAMKDPWGKVLRYRPVQYYPYDATAPTGTPPSPPIIDSDKPPNPDSFQLWSSGVDETEGYGDPSTDDITNWK